jgi:hypothetical protein
MFKPVGQSAKAISYEVRIKNGRTENNPQPKAVLNLLGICLGEIRPGQNFAKHDHKNLNEVKTCFSFLLVLIPVLWLSDAYEGALG